MTLKEPICRERDADPGGGDGTPTLATGLTLSTTAGELGFGTLLVGDVDNIGTPRERPPGDSAEDSEEVTASSMARGCDDGETRGDIPSEDAVTCGRMKETEEIPSKRLMSVQFRRYTNSTYILCRNQRD